MLTFKIIDKEDFMDELTSVRNIYKNSFKDMVIETVSKLAQSESPLLLKSAILPVQPPTSPTLSINTPFSFDSQNLFMNIDSKFDSLLSEIQPSRFRDEYRLQRRIGKGGIH